MTKEEAIEMVRQDIGKALLYNYKGGVHPDDTPDFHDLSFRLFDIDAVDESEPKDYNRCWVVTIRFNKDFRWGNEDYGYIEVNIQNDLTTETNQQKNKEHE